MKPSALGYYLLLVPTFHPAPLTWAVVSFNKAGRMRAACPGFATREAAAAERAKWMRRHKQLAAEYAARAAKRMRSR